MNETVQFDTLAAILFDGTVAAVDFKTMPGTEESLPRDELAWALLESMKRMGLIVDGNLTNRLQAQS